MDVEESPGSSWPDETERRRWEDALAAVAARESGERGVREPAFLTVGYGELWVNYGLICFSVVGEYAGVRDEAELFAHIDR